MAERAVYYLIATDAEGRVVGSLKVTARPQTIGRAPDCGLILASSGVSRTHASVYLQGAGVVIADEGSANGVKVDGKLITGPTLVDHTNRIQLSSYSLRFEPEGPDGSLPHSARPDEQQFELDTRLEAHAGAGAALAAAALELAGRVAPYKGVRFRLDKPLMTVGRVESNDIVIEDPSISRRHAQLRLSVTGKRLTVLDLRSHNGTYVDGQRVRRADAEPGQIIRFGDIAFKLGHRRSQGKGRSSGISRRGRIFVGASIVVLLLAAVGVAAYLRRQPPPKKPRASAEERLRRIQQETEAKLEKARSKTAQREWSAAIVLLDQVIDADPLNKAAKKLREQALAELGNERVFEDGLKFFALGNEENLVKAKEIFKRIPESSVYHREVRRKVKTIDERVAESYRIDGVSRCKARYWKRCQRSLCKFFELMPPERAITNEEKLRKMLQGAERRLKRRHDFMPCKASRLVAESAEGVGSGPSAGDLLEEKYPEPRIRAVVQDYIAGKIDAAFKAVNKLRQRREMRPHQSVLSEIHRQLLIVRGKYQEGYSSLRERDAAAADKDWSLVLAADRALVPKGVESFYRKEVVRALSSLYHELGEEQFKMARHRQAFALWQRGKALAPSEPRLLNDMLQLEKVAERLLREGRELATTGKVREARSKLELARDICEPGKAPRKEAEAALAEL